MVLRHRSPLPDRSVAEVGAGRSELVRVRGDPLRIPDRSDIRGTVLPAVQRAWDAGGDGELSRVSDRYRHGRRAEVADAEQCDSGERRVVQHLRGARGDALAWVRGAGGDREV